MTTPGDGSGFKGHLVRRPGRIETAPGADEVERWETIDWQAFHQGAYPEWGILIGTETVRCSNRAIRDLICTLHNTREAAQQTIAELRKALEEQRKFLKRMREWDHLEGSGDGPYWRIEIDRHLATIAATEEGKSS